MAVTNMKEATNGLIPQEVWSLRKIYGMLRRWIIQAGIKVQALPHKNGIVSFEFEIHGQKFQGDGNGSDAFLGGLFLIFDEMVWVSEGDPEWDPAPPVKPALAKKKSIVVVTNKAQTRQSVWRDGVQIEPNAAYAANWVERLDALGVDYDLIVAENTSKLDEIHNEMRSRTSPKLLPAMDRLYYVKDDRGYRMTDSNDSFWVDTLEGCDHAISYYHEVNYPNGPWHVFEATTGQPVKSVSYDNEDSVAIETWDYLFLSKNTPGSPAEFAEFDTAQMEAYVMKHVYGR